jgi:hypothetical protein
MCEEKEFDAKEALTKVADALADSDSVQVMSTEPTWSRNWNAYIIDIEVDGVDCVLALNDR